MADEEGASGPLALAVAMIAIAGFVDACGFVRLGQVFVSFMSGNSTKLAVFGLQAGGRAQAAAALGLIVLFVMGAFAGRLIALASGERRRSVTLAVVSALLLLAALALGGPSGEGGAVLVGAAAMALAMGVQNSVLHKADGVQAGLSYVTGALVDLGHELANALSGAPSHWGASLSLWIGLFAGGCLGVELTGRLGGWALLLPAAAAALLALWLGALVRRPSADRSPP